MEHQVYADDWLISIGCDKRYGCHTLLLRKHYYSWLISETTYGPLSSLHTYRSCMYQPEIASPYCKMRSKCIVCIIVGKYNDCIDKLRGAVSTICINRTVDTYLWRYSINQKPIDSSPESDNNVTGSTLATPGMRNHGCGLVFALLKGFHSRLLRLHSLHSGHQTKVHDVKSRG